MSNLSDPKAKCYNGVLPRSDLWNDAVLLATERPTHSDPEAEGDKCLLPTYLTTDQWRAVSSKVAPV